MRLKNYTSGMPPSRSVAKIEECLVEVGATGIAKTYAAGHLTGITFQIMQNGAPLVFKLPANVEDIVKQMLTDIKRARRGTEQRVTDQAERTAWKLLLDWVEVQASMILIGRRQAVEVFLPYVYNPATEQTFFERLQESKFKLLEHRP